MSEAQIIKIKKLSIKKFRGFQDVQFQLGEYLTAIAGQNGTQKTTLLGMISQPFSITDKDNPVYGEKPLCGGNFKSAFSEKFKLSENFDKPKQHEWTLNLNRDNGSDFTIESIKRDGKNKGVRFWKKGDRTKGAGYIQMPVIYLSLSRFFPIGEDKKINTSSDVILAPEEFDFYQKWHNKILITPDLNIHDVDYLASKQKNTLGANTEYYDWKMNSAGQDNIGKIILAIISFKRLYEKHRDSYSGGILAIDELDAALYPGSQIKLIEALRKFASDYKIQIIFTTHSLSILKKTCELQEDTKCAGQTKVVYLKKINQQVKAIENLSYPTIMHELNITLDMANKIIKIPVYTEDLEGKIFLFALLKRKTALLNWYNCNLGCTNYIELSKKKIPGFKFPDSLIVLDGDAINSDAQIRTLKKSKNILLLPGDKSPERILAKYLFNLDDESPVWNGIRNGYSKQLCFKDYSYNEINRDRNKAKDWFKSQMKYWGRGCAKVINPWIEENKATVDQFIKEFEQIYEKLLKYFN